MLTIFYGNDEVVVRGKARKEALSHVGEGADLFVMEGDSFDVGRFQDVFFTSSLFGGKKDKQVILCDHVFENAEAKSFFEDNAKEITEAENICVLAEKTLLVGAIAKYKKAGATLIDAKTIKKDTRTFNTFALGDALGMKDKKNLWVLFAQAREAGLEGEEVCGVLIWQVKNILLALSTKTFAEAGVSEFPYKKAKQFSKVWKESELQGALLLLTKMYHEAHRGKGDLMNQLELFVLGVK